MKVKELYVSLENPVEVFTIIENVLNDNRNTQVYVADAIIECLNQKGKEYHIYCPNYLKTHHYNVDNDNFGGEDWYELTEGYVFDKTIAKASFIGNCIGYEQLVEFKSKKVKKYTHFSVGFEQLLLIEVEK